jgi:hypothetical protein
VTATITAVDRKAYDEAASATVEPVRWWRERPSTQTLFMHPELFRALREELLATDFDDYVFRQGDHGFYGPSILEMMQRRPLGTLSAPAVVALTTFCALEWLRHRKQAVAEAERSGDYAPLLTEFIAWLRALFASWRPALAAPTYQIPLARPAKRTHGSGSHDPA